MEPVVRRPASSGAASLNFYRSNAKMGIELWK